MTIDRRVFLGASAAFGAFALAGGSSFAANDQLEFTLPPLPYAHDALEPVIDAETMKIHHDMHHATYVKKLNEALAGHKKLQGRSIEDLLARDAAVAPEPIRKTVIDQGGGHANHSLFWPSLGPPKTGNAPAGKFAALIDSDFASFDKLKAKMIEAGEKQFGSGWAWLVKTHDGRLQVTSTANQDSPLMKGQTPLLGIDVWEHAYYLKYKNKRGEYLKAIWDLIQWPVVANRYGG